MWPNLHKTEDLVTFTEEVLHGNFIFLCSVWFIDVSKNNIIFYIYQIRKKMCLMNLGVGTKFLLIAANYECTIVI